MSFGLCNAPARLMDSVLTGLKWEICLAYLDDTIFAKDWADHLNRLCQVF